MPSRRRRRLTPDEAHEAWDREVRRLLPGASEETLRQAVDYCAATSPRGPGPSARTTAGFIRSLAGWDGGDEDGEVEREARAEMRRIEREAMRRTRG